MTQFVSKYNDAIPVAADVIACRFLGYDGKHAVIAGNALGVARTDAISGALCPTDMLGSAIVEAAGAIPAFTSVQVGADGRAVALVDGIKVGRTHRQPAVRVGDMVEIFLIPN